MRNVTIILCVLSSIFAVVLGDSPKDWVCNGRDVQGSTAQANVHRINKNRAASLSQTWTALGSGVTGAPVVQNRIAYVARFDGTLDAYVVNTGMRLWSSGFINGQIEGAAASVNLYTFLDAILQHHPTNQVKQWSQLSTVLMVN